MAGRCRERQRELCTPRGGHSEGGNGDEVAGGIHQPQLVDVVAVGRLKTADTQSRRLISREFENPATWQIVAFEARLPPT